MRSCSPACTSRSSQMREMMHKSYFSDVEKDPSSSFIQTTIIQSFVHVSHPFIRRCVLVCHKSFFLPLTNCKGAKDPKEIIEKLRALPNLRYLNLNHSGLGVEELKVLFRWLSYGDGDDGDDVGEENNSCLSRPPGLLQLTNINLAGAHLGDVGFGALVGWLERLKKWHQTEMNTSSSSSPDGIRGLHLQNVCLYFHFLDLCFDLQSSNSRIISLGHQN